MPNNLTKAIYGLRRRVLNRLAGCHSGDAVEPAIQLDHKILVGTHHKTGTVWLAAIFEQLCNRLGLAYVKSGVDSLPAAFDVWLEDHSQFGSMLQQGGYRGVHIIRDPRDVIVSACRYHQTSNEPQLHVPKPEFGGMTYQEKLCSLEPDAQLLLEMEHSAGYNIRCMTEWDYSNPDFFEVKYEDLMADTDLLLFHRIFTFLGFPAEVLPTVLGIAYNNSLFSGRVASTHVRSGRSRQWEAHFKPVHKERFHQLFGDALMQLGYETGRDW